jgi:hypothetical protein
VRNEEGCGGARTGTLAAAFWCRAALSSIVEVTRFQLGRFAVNIKELAEWFGLEVARIVVDECLASRES